MPNNRVASKPLTVGALFAVLCLLVSWSAPLRADDDTIFIIHKQHVKERGRWTLEDWLEQRDRMRLMDLWLALHSPSPYEFYVGGNYEWGPLRTGQWMSGWRGFVAAYASIFGLELQREFTPAPASWLGLFNLRVFGLHAQGTNITLQGGVRNVQGATSTWQPVAGVSLTFYFKKFFGIEGLYRHYFASTVSAVGAPQNSDRFEAGGFIEFSFVRIFADYFHETLEYQGVTGSTASGGQIGTKIFF